MIRKELKLSSGQNIRYLGKGFAGYIKGQPYMVFLSYHSIHEMLVRYNDTDIIVSKYHAEPIQ